MFFIKPSTLTIDCFTADQLAHDLFPITKATKHFPEWFKDMPATYSTTTKEGVPVEFSTMMH